MAIITYNKAARRRINRAVKWVERHGKADTESNRVAWGDSGQQQRLVIAKADVEHGQSGTFQMASAPDYTTGWTALTSPANDEFGAYNFRDKIWQGASCLISPAALADLDGGLGWVCAFAWSATRIRGTSTAAIGPGVVGSLTSATTVALNGHYTVPATVSVYNPTTFQTIDSGVKVWAELVYSASTASSRWEVYAADCAGT